MSDVFFLYCRFLHVFSPGNACGVTSQEITSVKLNEMSRYLSSVDLKISKTIKSLDLPFGVKNPNFLGD